MTIKPRPPLPWWQIILIRKTGVPLGRVQARNADEALKIAAEKFGLDSERCKRLAARPISIEEG